MGGGVGGVGGWVGGFIMWQGVLFVLFDQVCT